MIKPWEMAIVKERVKDWVLEDYLTDYQKEAWEWSIHRDGSLLWWACGAGKTLGALLWLVSGPLTEKKLVVTRAPAKNQWKFQAAQYTNLNLKVLGGYSSHLLSSDTECVVVSWEMLPYWHESIKTWAQGSRLAIVWDELHKGKA